MSTANRGQQARAIALALAITAIAFTFIITDIHKTAIGTVWPSIVLIGDFLGLPLYE